MICENTISAGFHFMLGKFLFDAAVVGSVLFGALVFWVAVTLLSKERRK